MIDYWWWMMVLGRAEAKLVDGMGGIPRLISAASAGGGGGMTGQDAGLVYVSAGWEVDLGRRQLRLDGMSVPIGGRAFEIVGVLVRGGGELVTKNDLMARVWPGAIVEENTLQVHISAVRRALGPHRDMLKTESGRGYRLLGNWTLRREMGVPDSVPDGGAQPLRRFRSNFPGAASDVIGRAAAANELLDLISAYRLVTLTGPGGIGKTSLALKAARSLFANFEGDGWLIELGSLSDGAFVPSAVAGILGLKLGGDEISDDLIAQAIGEKKLLFVLDSCEHVVNAATAFVETLMRRCPGVSVLATSREVLRVQGEHVYRVPPLSVPPETASEPGEIVEYSAVQLFLARTRALDATFSPSSADLLTVAAICRRLDGIPLAIEFAAARAATLGLHQVATRLGDRFGLLTGGHRMALPRHQTLRATLDWSYELLSEWEQQLLCRLSIFGAGFGLDAAVAIVSDTGRPTSAVIEGVSNLISKSLIALDSAGSPGRWRLLESIRAYALEKLGDRRESEWVARRHAEFLCDLFQGERFGPKVGAEEGKRYVLELDNVRSALDWALSPSGDMSLGVVLTAAFSPGWLHMSVMVECRERTERAAACLASGIGVDPRLRMQLRVALGVSLVFTMAPLKRTEEVLVAALEDAEALNDFDAQVRVLWALWAAYFNAGERHAAQSAAERFAVAAGRVGNADDLLVAERLLGIAKHYRGNLTEARRHLERVLERVAASDDVGPHIRYHHDQQVMARAMLARVLVLQGFPEQARLQAHSSFKEAQDTDHILSLRYAISWGVCPVALMTGDLATAERSMRLLASLSAKNDPPSWRSMEQALEGRLLVKRGAFAAGVAMLQIAIKDMRYADLLGILAEGLAGLGRHGDALSTIDDALDRSERAGEEWCLAEILRVKGELLVAAEAGSVHAAADALFNRSIEVAQQQKALFWELRSTMSLSRSLCARGRSIDAHALLSCVYEKFSEGFETADLADATAMIAKLAP